MAVNLEIWRGQKSRPWANSKYLEFEMRGRSTLSMVSPALCAKRSGSTRSMTKFCAVVSETYVYHSILTLSVNFEELVLGSFRMDGWMEYWINLQKLKVPEISSGPRQEKRDKSAGWLAGRPDESSKTDGTSRLYRSQTLRVNSHLKALAEIYII